MNLKVKKPLVAFFLMATFSLFTDGAFAGPIPDTGQTKCYNNTVEIPCPAPGQPFYGQDGNYNINPPSYTKLGAAGEVLPDNAATWTMIRDNVTGLIWENKTNDGSIRDAGKTFTWCDRNPATNGGNQGVCQTGTGIAARDTDAFINALSALKLGGYSDWRMPSAKELETITDSSRINPAVNRAWFPHTVSSSNYWSSTNYAYYGLNKFAWCVNFILGHVINGFHKSNDYSVLAVRGGQTRVSNELIVNGDGTVTDTLTGLMWSQETGTEINWAAALSYAEGLELAGYDDWRLPNITELQSLADYNLPNLAIDAQAFPGTLLQGYWSSTTNASSGRDAWFVYFGNGRVGNDTKSAAYAVRAVRGGQARLLGNLFISAPAQAARWEVGSPQVIAWDAAGISGNVKITLSRQGGKQGTFTEVVAANAPNSGVYNWSVNGSGSANCILKIESLSNPSKVAITGLFSISETWLIGEYKNITWDKGKFSGPVKISLSRQGGAVDTFQTIVVSAENSGAYQWKVEGPTSDRCIVKIESLSNSTQAAVIALYTILSDTISYNFIRTSSVSTLQKYNIYLMGKTAATGLEIPVSAVSWTVSDPTVASLRENALLGLKTGVVTVSTNYQGKEYRKSLYFKTGFDQFENQNNNTLETAQLLTDGRFLEGELLNGHADYYKIACPTDSWLELSYFSYSPTADVRLELFDEAHRSVVSLYSNNGQSRTISLGLRSGTYFLKLSTIGDVDENNGYVLIYKTFSLQKPGNFVEAELNDTYQQAILIRINETFQGQFRTTADIDFYALDVPNPVYLDLLFTCPDSRKYCDISIYKESDQNLINQIQATGGSSVTLPMGLSIGKYFVKVTGSGDEVDTEPPYFLTLKPSSVAHIEIESNNTYRFANPIDPTGDRTGRIFSSPDIDYYGFYLQQPGFSEIYFTPASNTTADYKISLVDKDDQAFYTKTSTNGQGVTLRFNRDMPGNYYIKIESAGDIDQYSDYRISMNGPNITGLKSLASITIEASKTSIAVDEEIQLTANAFYTDATTESIVNPAWSSLNPSIATIGQTGKLKGVAAGNVNVVSVSGGLTGKMNFTVGSPVSGIVNHHGNLIVVAGGGVADTNTLKEPTQYIANLVYKRFKSRLFADEDIWYINPLSWQDLDGDGYSDNIVDDTTPTVARLGQAITNWAASQSTDGPLYLYLIDHGGIDSFMIFPDQIITANELNQFITTFQNQTRRKVVVIIEACKSGSFTDNLVAPGQDRIVITSADDQDSYMHLGGRISFSQFFVDRLLTGDSLRAGYDKAKKQLADMGLPYNRMKPQLTEGVSFSAAAVRIGGDFLIAGLSPGFTETTPSKQITANTPQNLTAQNFHATLSGLEGIEAVWAVVVPPDYVPPALSQDLQAPTVSLPIFTLTDPEKDKRFEGSYNGFTHNGDYRITFYARNTNGMVEVSSPITMTVTGGINTANTLTVSRTGAGSGTVASSSAGISCGVQCTKTFAQPTQVTLTATPDSRSEFTGWSGACTGSGGCTLLVEGGKSVTAAFTQKYIKGDLNDDGAVTLADAILALKATVGLTLSGLRTDYASSGIDVNGDNRIGLAEAIYILQKVAGVR